MSAPFSSATLSAHLRRSGVSEVSVVPDDGDARRLMAALSGVLPAGRASVRANRIGLGIDDAALLLDPATDEIVKLEWDAEALRAVENRAHARRVLPALRANMERIKAGGAALARTLLPPTADLARLDDHQLVNVAIMTIRNAFGACIFDEQGTGKTVVVIEAFDLLVDRRDADTLFIVAPKSMLGEWREEFRRFKGDLYKVAIVTGSAAERSDAIRSGADVLVLNFEAVEASVVELRALARRCRGTVLVVDESFNVKNAATRRSRAVRALREWCTRAFVLCGTPAPNEPADLVAQADLVDHGVAFAGVTLPKDRAAALPIVQSVLESRCIFTRHVKSAVLPGLPGRRFTKLLVDFEPTQRRAYEAALEDLLLDLRRTDAAAFSRHITSFLARRQSLLRICSNPTAVIPGYDAVPTKHQALDALLADLVGRRREKVVIWSFYRASLEAIHLRYGAYGAVRYDGSVSDVDVRREAVAAFQRDDATMLFVANPSAAGAGLTLHRARVAVYESLPNQAAHFLQSVDRIHRRGQTREVECFVLLCRDSLELLEYDRLITKRDAQARLLGDTGDAPLSRETMLAELIEARTLLAGDSA